MDLFRWRRTLLRALGPAVLCATLAGWGVYALTADERPTYRSKALLNTGIMAAHEAGNGSYVRDVVINELEGIMNLARSQETREELAARLLADFLSLDGPHPEVISPRAYGDLLAELDQGILNRHVSGRPGRRPGDAIYASIVAERDSLLRYGEASAKHPLIELLYGDDPLVGAEQLATLRVNRKGLSDILELSYATVDAAWCKHTLDRHLEVFLSAHREASEKRRSNALAYFRSATDESRARLAEVEEELRRFATRNKIINYYEQTRYIASVKNQVDQRYTEEAMAEAAADSTVAVLERKLAKRTDLIRLNNLVDDRRRRIGELSREQTRLEVMAADSAGAEATARIDAIAAEMSGLRAELTRDVAGLQVVHSGPEGLELGRLISEWLSASLAVEEARGRLQVLRDRRIDFDKIYTRMAGLGSRLKQLEREGDVAEEDYLERLRALNAALQREHSSGTNTDVRLLDAPALPTKPEPSKRLILVAVGALLGGGLPVVLAVALMLLSGALLSFAEAHRRTGLAVIGGVARWGWLSERLRRKSKPSVAATTADLLWQNLLSGWPERADAETPRSLALASLRPGTGKSHVGALLAERLAARGMRVLLVDADAPASGAFDLARTDADRALANGLRPHERLGMSAADYRAYDLVIYELAALGTGRLPVPTARHCEVAALVHPAAEGWTDPDATALRQLSEALGGAPRLVLNGLALPVLLHEWGVSLAEVRRWGRASERSPGPPSSPGTATPPGRVSPPTAIAPTAATETAAVAPAGSGQDVPPAKDGEAREAQRPQRTAAQKWTGTIASFALPEEPTTPAPFPRREAREASAEDAAGDIADWEADLLA